MARTKQTARKSTGGQAPRMPLNRFQQPTFHSLRYEKLPLKQHIVLEKPIVPDAVTTSNAQKTVLSSPDLLIIILSQLPHSSLLKAKQVNKTWASLFGNAEIRASLFEIPRPEESAAYTETYSDVLMDKLPTFWSINDEGSDKVELKGGMTLVKKPRVKESNETSSDDPPKVHDPSAMLPVKIKVVQMQVPKYTDKSHPWQWRQLLLFQPAVEVLEIVQTIDIRGGGTEEFRTTIPFPGGIRMGCLYDAIRHWHEVERSRVVLLWNRMTGDLIENWHFYEDGSSYKTGDDKPCVTMLGENSVGCGQYGGLTYANYILAMRTGETLKPRVMKHGSREVEYSMSGPKKRECDWALFSAAHEGTDVEFDTDDEAEDDENEEDEEETGAENH